MCAIIYGIFKFITKKCGIFRTKLNSPFHLAVWKASELDDRLRPSLINQTIVQPPFLGLLPQPQGIRDLQFASYKHAIISGQQTVLVRKLCHVIIRLIAYIARFCAEGIELKPRKIAKRIARRTHTYLFKIKALQGISQWAK